MARKYALLPGFEDFVRKNMLTMSNDQLAAAIREKYGIEMSRAAVHTYISNHKLKTPEGVNRRKLAGFAHKKKYPEGFEEWLYSVYRDHSRKEMVAQAKELFGLDMTPAAIHGCIRRFGFPPSGRTGYWVLEQIDRHVPRPPKTPEALERWKNAQFKSGNRPHTYQPVGTLIKRGYERSHYWVRKVADPNVWQFEHRRLWEEAFGPIPDDVRIIFLDGNTDNLNLENLRPVTKGELSAMNKKHRFSVEPDITEIGILLTRTEQTIKRKREEKESGR